MGEGFKALRRRGGVKAEWRKGPQKHSGEEGGTKGAVGKKDKVSEEKRRGQRHEMVRKDRHAWEFSNIIFIVTL